MRMRRFTTELKARVVREKYNRKKALPQFISQMERFKIAAYETHARYGMSR